MADTGTNQADTESASFEEEPSFVLPHRKQEDTEMDITPMIDITFLLLIFFLVAAKMEEQADVTLPTAKYGLPIASKEAVNVIVKGAGPDKVVVMTGHGKTLSSDIMTQEDEIAQYVANGLDGVKEFGDRKHHVLIRAEKGIKFREVDRVSRACGKGKDLSAEGALLPSLHIAVLELQ